VTLHHAIGNGVAGLHHAIAGSDAGRRMTRARRIVACEAAAGWGMTCKSVPSTARCSVHGMKAATRSAAAGMKAAAVKSSGGTHAAWMEATSTRVEAASATVEAATTAGMKTTAATAGVETTATASMGCAATAAAPWGRLRQVSQREACNRGCEDRGDHQPSLSAEHSHVVLHLAEGRSEQPAMPRTTFENSVLRSVLFYEQS
ncbi:MAG: hypothetical protein WA702_28435, partial [Bradyrhizobium sp.]|uniref:hypothetical protein n=1 Tax=Bradyrhizobium sp. TaxID=376 RepID=UPI003C7D2E77